MIPTDGINNNSQAPFPRMSGDDPGKHKLIVDTYNFSPHERG